MKENTRKKDSLIGDIIFFASLLILGAAIIFTFFNANDPTGTFIFGYKPLMVKSDSMAPELAVNSLILTKQAPYEEIKEMDIITFKTDDGLYICHRVRVVTENGFITKGDNNRSVDEQFVKKENYLGKVIWKTELIAEFIAMFSAPTFGRIFTFVIFPAAVIATIIFGKSVIKSSRKKKEIDTPDNLD